MEIDLAIVNFPKQQSIFDSPASYKIVQKGRRFGLTKGAANDFINCSLTKKFKHGLWVDTVNSNIDRYVERYFLPHLNKVPRQIWNWRQQQKVLEVRESYIDFRSADRPENIEGFGYDKLFLNEAGIILKDEYLWQNSIKPMLWDYKPKAVIGGTPKGKGQFFLLCELAKKEGLPGYQHFHFSPFDNPYLNHDKIREEMKLMPQMVIAQEVYGEFCDDSGVVFRGVTRIASAIPQKPVKDHSYVMGVDLAKVQDWTVIAVYDRRTNAQVYQDRFQTLEWPFQKAKIKAICQHYNNALIMLDATGLGDPIADDLTRESLPVEPIKLTNEMKKEIIEKLIIWIDQEKLKMINMPETISEFTNFTYDISSSGKIRYEAPAGFHDDIVIAHALAVWSLTPLFTQRLVKKKTPIQLAKDRSTLRYELEDELEEAEWSQI